MDKSSKKFEFLSKKPSLARLDILPFIFLHILLSIVLQQIEFSEIIRYILFFALIFLQGLVFFSQFWSDSIKRLIVFNGATISNATDVFISITHLKFKMNDRTLIVPIEKDNDMTYIIVENVKFVLADGSFKKPPSFKGRKVKDFLKGVSEFSEDMKKRHGRNEMKMPIPSFLELYKEHVVAPFFVFQLFCIMLWVFDDYGIQSFTSLTMLCIFEATVVSQRIINITSLRKMRVPPHFIMVYRDKTWSKVSSEDLIPGDIVSVVEGLSLEIIKEEVDESKLGFFEKQLRRLKKIKEQADAKKNRQNIDQLITQCKEKEPQALTCDLILLSGSVTVNEAMLTGESTPQIKDSIEKNDVTWDLVLDSKKRNKNNMLFAGTKVVKTSFSEAEGDHLPEGITTMPPDRGVVCQVYKTGFSTQQGKLLRTVLFTKDRNMAENKEAFAFIFILLLIAIYSAYVVLIDGLEREGAFTYKLFLRIIIILTSVVPSELPIEMTLAINNSLFFLQSKQIMCIEPFRIPYAGTVDILCFDKTGTLTKDEFEVNGVVDESGEIKDLSVVSDDTLSVLTGCNSLQMISKKIVGDPVEISIFTVLKGEINRYEVLQSKLIPGKTCDIKQIRRYAFDSNLKRMSVLCNYSYSGSSKLRVLSKGAPEVIKPLLSNVPYNYDQIANKYANKGFRLLTLAYRDDDTLTSSTLRKDVEKDLIFAGFLLVQTPLKNDTAAYIKEFKKAGYPIAIITGDHKFTTAKIAEELKINDNKIAFLRIKGDKADLLDLTDNVYETIDLNTLSEKKTSYLLGIEGKELNLFLDNKTISKQIDSIQIFARVDPNQKDDIIKAMIEAGRTPSMCGDGSNDVGALKRASIGVALLNADDPKKKEDEQEPPFSLLTLDDDTLLKAGDVTAAAPFTSKSGSIKAVKNILIQGRCTHMITYQMYKILALNCLMSAYCFSVLALKGVKFSDYQSTYLGFASAFLFMMQSRSKPLKNLNTSRPDTTIFTFASIISIVGQATAHYFTLYYLIQLTASWDESIITKVKSLDEQFEKTLLNSVCYVFIFFIQACNFIVNYQGEPFMQSISENVWILRLCMAIFATVISIVIGWSPLMEDTLEVLPLPRDLSYQATFVGILLLNLIVCYALENWKKLINK